MKIAVGMSGGVDSAVTAALLLEEGHEVVGVSMLTGYSTSSRCCSEEDLVDARCVARKLGIAHEVIDLKEPFQDQVVQPFIQTYEKGKTPNPCPGCNADLKFGKLWEMVKQQFQVNKFATGHYAKVFYNSVLGRYQIFQATDLSRDQSYVLYQLSQEQLASALFPLGAYTKTQIREIARQKNLVTVSHKPDSQDLCFIQTTLKDFWTTRSPHSLVPGEIISTTGQQLGTHEGIVQYTVGQRKGLGLAAPAPLYVLEIDGEHHQLIVGPKENTWKKSCSIQQVNWVSIEAPCSTLQVLVKLRYAAPTIPATLVPGEVDHQLYFATLQSSVTPGQAAVFYGDNGLLLGGGVIGSSSSKDT